MTAKYNTNFTPVYIYSYANNKWTNVTYKNWNGSTSICYIPPYDKLIYIGKPPWPNQKNKYWKSPNRLHIYDYNKDILISTAVQLPRTHTEYSVGLTHDTAITNKFVHNYLKHHYPDMAINIRYVITQYVDIWSLHIIDNQSDHYVLDIDIIMNSKYTDFV